MQKNLTSSKKLHQVPTYLQYIIEIIYKKTQMKQIYRVKGHTAFIHSGKINR